MSYILQRLKISHVGFILLRNLTIKKAMNFYIILELL
jgi:hypothetical protein